MQEFATVSALAGDPKFREAAEKPLRVVNKANENVGSKLGQRGGETVWCVHHF